MTLHASLFSEDLEQLALRAQRAPTLAEVRTMGRSAMGIFVELAKEQAPRRTGAMAATLGYASRLFPDGIELRHRSGGATGTGVEYARFVAGGTGIFHEGEPHAEWSVDYLFQSFDWDGAHIETMFTHHFGQKPSDFEKRAAARLEGYLPVVAATGGRRLVRFLRTGVEDASA